MGKAAEIAKANDAFRRAALQGEPIQGRAVMTNGVAALPSKALVLQAVADFTEFAPENDPYGEHDFGVVEVGGETFYFKIDYYDPTYEFGLEPDDEQVHRVLTIMLASEY